MFKVKNDVVIDEVGTFGTLKFLGLGNERQDYDEETGEIGDVTRRTYDVRSEKLKRVVEIHVPADAPIFEYPFDAVVTLTDLDIRPYNFGTERSGFAVRASGIELVQKGNIKTPPANQTNDGNK